MRLIDADKIVFEYSKLREIGPFDIAGIVDCFAKQIQSAPTIDAEPVRHGRWEMVEDPWFSDVCKCTACGEEYVLEYVLEADTPSEYGYNYCPNCGAKMDLEDEK